MKTIAVILFFLFTWFISTPFTNFKASQQTLFGGRAKSGKTIHYQFKTKARVASTDFSIDGIWIGNDMVKFQVYSISREKERSTNFQRGDSIFIDAYQYSRPDPEGNLKVKKENNTSAPEEYKGLALIKYRYKNTEKYVVIKHISTLPSVYMP